MLSWSLFWLALGAMLGLLYQHRARIRRAYRSWRAASRGHAICTGCDHEIDEAWCHCGEATEQHTAYSGHSPVPMGCRCHEDRGEEMRA